VREERKEEQRRGGTNGASGPESEEGALPTQLSTTRRCAPYHIGAQADPGRKPAPCDWTGVRRRGSTWTCGPSAGREMGGVEEGRGESTAASSSESRPIVGPREADAIPVCSLTRRRNQPLASRSRRLGSSSAQRVCGGKISASRRRPILGKLAGGGGIIYKRTRAQFRGGI
jgi:hypothetical protein